MRISDWSSDVCSSDLERERDVVRRGEHVSGLAIDDDQLSFTQHAARIAQTDDRRDAEAACEDRGMRQRAAIFGNERGDVQLREQDDVGRRDVVRSEEHTSELQSLMRISYAVFCV